MYQERNAVSHATLETFRPESHSSHKSADVAGRQVTPPASRGTYQVQKAEEHYFAYGKHSEVFKGCYNERLVAIKQLRGINSSKAEIRDRLRQSLQVQLNTSWQHLDHPNVCKIYMIAEGFGFLPALVMTYYQRGTIVKHIQKHNPQIDQRIKWVSEIADGLSYLHSMAVYHGDLRGVNIFLDDNNCAVIADYAIAHYFNHSGSTSAKSTGIIRWIAPEVIALPPNPNLQPEKIDIFAFGMTMLEIISGDSPYSDKSDTGALFAVSAHEAPKLPQSIVGNTELKDLFDACTQPVLEDRPSAEHAAYVLRTLLPPSGLFQRLLWHVSRWIWS